MLNPRQPQSAWLSLYKRPKDRSAATDPGVEWGMGVLSPDVFPSFVKMLAQMTTSVNPGVSDSIERTGWLEVLANSNSVYLTLNEPSPLMLVPR